MGPLQRYRLALSTTIDHRVFFRDKSFSATKDLHPTLHQISQTMLFCVAILSAFIVSCTAQACYWPDGSLADGAYKPCASNSRICCYNLDADHHDLCYSNGFCMSLYWGFLYRGACTDSSWGANSGCASGCKAGKSIVTTTYLIRTFADSSSSSVQLLRTIRHMQ